MFTGDLKKKKRLQTVKPALNFFVAYVKKKKLQTVKPAFNFFVAYELKTR